jgi:hypothetical protein
MNISTFHYRDVLVGRYDLESGVFELGKDANLCNWSKSDLAMFTSWLITVAAHMNGCSVTGETIHSFELL